jgi:hypothetical protein
MLVGLDGTDARTAIAGVSERAGWEPHIDANGIRYYMVGEHVAQGPPPVGSTPVATLVRLDLARGPVEQIPDVIGDSANFRSRVFYYRRAVAGARLPELHYRNAAGADRSLGGSAGAVQLFGGDKLYFVAGDDRNLSRITSFAAEIETVRAHVTRFLIRDDDKMAVLSVTENGRAQSLTLDLQTREERKLPGGNPDRWIGFAGPLFVYSEAAAGSTNGKFHTYNTQTGEDHVIELPAGLSDVSAIVPRNNSDLQLWFDSHGRVGQFSPSAMTVELLDFRPLSPSFTDDGRFLIYLDPDPNADAAQPAGRLLVRDADFQSPPRALSDPGTVVPSFGFFFLPKRDSKPIFVFWSHFARSAADLYFADIETGEKQLVASAISEVTVDASRLRGIVRVSQQDAVGDLVEKDLTTGEETQIAHRVSDAAFAGSDVIFVIRERVPADIDGLWVGCLSMDEEQRRQGCRH